MKIIQLESENVKRLKAISIKPDGSIVVIGGNNAQGKSSVLDSIEYALGGKNSIPGRPIRDGEDSARIVVDLEEIQVIRTFTKHGTNLVVKSKDGATFPSPQAMLDKLVGNLSFDPLEFSRMDSKKRADTLKKVVGLDFDDLNSEYKAIFDQRTIINRKGKELKAQFDSIKHYKDVPDKEVSVKELSNQLVKALSENQDINSLEECIEQDKSNIKILDEQIKSLQEKRTSLIKGLENQNKRLESLEIYDVKNIQKEINSIEDTNNKVRENQKRFELEQQLESLRKESQSLSEKLLSINEVKQNSLSMAKFPINGLAFVEENDETMLTFNGIPFDQCSSAEQLKVSVAMSLSMNPQLRVLLIRDGSLLDSNNLKMIADMASKVDAQVWIERVSKGKECQIIIEDGSIVKG